MESQIGSCRGWVWFPYGPWLVALVHKRDVMEAEGESGGTRWGSRVVDGGGAGEPIEVAMKVEVEGEPSAAGWRWSEGGGWRWYMEV